MNRGITEEIKRNCTSSLVDSAATEIAVLLRRTANPIIIVRFATLDPRTLPTDSPPSPMDAAMVETESSGRDVVTDNRMKPAAICDKPRTLDKTMTYLMTLSLSRVINNSDTANKGTVYHSMRLTTKYPVSEKRLSTAQFILFS